MSNGKRSFFGRVNYPTIFFIVGAIVFSIFFNNMVVDIRLSEASYYLNRVSLKKFAQNSFLISSKYAMIQKRIEHGDNDVDNLIFEANMQAVLSEDYSNTDSSEYKQLHKYHPVQFILTTLRRILGKEELTTLKEREELNRELEISFFYQRNRDYQKAINNYNRILTERDIDRNLKSAIQLHRAFCVSMLGELHESSALYHSIYKEYPNTENGKISKSMRDFIYSLIDQNRKVQTTSKSNLIRGKNHYYNLNYKAALPLIQKVIETPNSPNIPEAHYYKGRIFEEQGKLPKSIVEYHKIMYLSSEDRWTIAANRRLTLLGTIYGKKHPILASAEANLVQLKDTAFLTRVKSIEIITERDSSVGGISATSEEVLLTEDTTLSILEIKSDFENVVSEKKNTVKVVKHKKLSNTSKAPKSLTAQERADRAKRLAQSEYRNQMFLRQTINSHSKQLKSVYIEFVNAGADVNGDITVKMRISPSGKVTASIVKTNITNRKFNDRIVREISSWKFPPIDQSLGTLTISYPFTFQ